MCKIFKINYKKISMMIALLYQHMIKVALLGKKIVLSQENLIANQALI